MNLGVIRKAEYINFLKKNHPEKIEKRKKKKKGKKKESSMLEVPKDTDGNSYSDFSGILSTSRDESIQTFEFELIV